LADLLQYLAKHGSDSLGGWHPQVLAYRERYGVG
jgi:orotate phosphoribosyltransferase